MANNYNPDPQEIGRDLDYDRC